MNKDIDYDELDQAVSSAMGSGGTGGESSPEPQRVVPPAETESGGKEAPKLPAAKPKPRGFYLDMVNPKSPMRPLKASNRPAAPAAQKPALAPKPTAARHATEFGVIEDFISEPTPIEPEILDAAEDPAPNPENYTLGGRSPFLENAIVEKRPLSDHIPDSHARSIRSTKNVYSERLVTSRQPVAPPMEHEIIPDKRPSGVARFLLVLLVIAIGAGIGAGAWYLISSGVISL